MNSASNGYEYPAQTQWGPALKAFPPLNCITVGSALGSQTPAALSPVTTAPSTTPPLHHSTTHTNTFSLDRSPVGGDIGAAVPGIESQATKRFPVRQLFYFILFPPRPSKDTNSPSLLPHTHLPTTAITPLHNGVANRRTSCCCAREEAAAPQRPPLHHRWFNRRRHRNLYAPTSPQAHLTEINLGSSFT